MAFPDRIERTVEIARPRPRVAALTTAEGLGTWFGNSATIDLRPGNGPDRLEHRRQGQPADRAGRGAHAVRLHLAHLRPARRRPASHLCRVHPRTGRHGTRLTVVESGFAQPPDDAHRTAYEGNNGWASELGDLIAYLNAA